MNDDQLVDRIVWVRSIRMAYRLHQLPARTAYEVSARQADTCPPSAEEVPDLAALELIYAQLGLWESGTIKQEIGIKRIVSPLLRPLERFTSRHEWTRIMYVQDYRPGQ